MTGKKAIVENTIRQYINVEKMQISEKALLDLEVRVRSIVETAIKKARANGRTTVMDRDMWGS